MKKMIKEILRRLGLKEINKFATYLRKFYYFILDGVGYALFLPLAVFSNKEKISEENVKKILIIRLDRIGDVVLSTPAIRAVRNSFKKAQIHLLVSDYTKDLVAGNPNINRLLVYKKDAIPKDYNLAIALHPGFVQNYITFASGAKFRIGYSGWGGAFFLTASIKDDRKTRPRHEVESALEIAELAGCSTGDKRLEVCVTREGEDFAGRFFQENNLAVMDTVVVMHAGARQECLRWKKDGFAEVADRLIKNFKVKVILTGSEGERGLVEDVVSLMKEKPIIAVGLKLTETVSLIKRCTLYVGNVTGPMHISDALNVPVVAIFGPVNPLESYTAWGPWGDGHKIVSKNLDCPDCHPTDCKTYDCLRLISAQEVLDAAIGQLEKKR